MGVKNLYKLIKESSPDVIKIIKISELNGWKIGIDASMSIYQWYSVGKVRKIVNKKGKYINHIQGAFFRTLNMILAGIKPVYIFDSAPPVIKSETIAKRKIARDTGTAVRVPREVFEEVKQLLVLMGIMVVQAASEAEATAAALTVNGSLDAVATEDMDAIPFGARFMIRGLDTAAKNITLIEHSKLLSELSLTREEFIDLCILLGTDYSSGLAKISYSRALTLIQKHKSIEQLLTNEKITPSKNFNWQAARVEFTSPKVNGVKFEPEIRKLNAEEIEKLKEFLITTHGLEPNRVKKSLEKLAKFHGTNLLM